MIRRLSAGTWLRHALVLLGLAASLAGCVDSSSYLDLPPLAQEPKVLTKDEAERAMVEIRRKADQQSADTLRQIETGSNKPKSP